MRATRLDSLPAADIRKMTQLCEQMGGVNLSQGVCNLPSPSILLEKTAHAVMADRSAYAPSQGIQALRDLIATKLRAENSANVDANLNVMVTQGVTGAFAAILQALFNKGDKLMLVEPYYGYHYTQATLAELEIICARPKAPELQLTSEVLNRAYTPGLKALLICSPGNPSGRMLTRSEMEAAIEFAKEKKLLLISDEIYEYFNFEGKQHLSLSSFPEAKDFGITMMGFSKTFSITGWRLGYIAAPERLIPSIVKCHDLLYVCAPTPLQHGVAEALPLIPKDYYDSLKTEFEKKRNQICTTLERIGLNPIIPEGAYYVLADIQKLNSANSIEASYYLLEKAKVATVPGAAFFQSEDADRFVRFCFAVTEQELNQACEFLEGAL